ncbi:MAG TPA: hypothetical protein VM325_18055 [Alphaproteobacteria bacterium]|nr:hypothetical protein [Alphaproteobacteria bacterium]
MPVFDDPDNPALDESERQTVNQRLNTLMADPVRQDFSEPEVVAYIDRQRDRLTDDNGVPIRSDFEPFRPAVTRSDARLESSVGDGEANHPLAVFSTKKLLNKSGFHTFKPGIEPIGEASPRFLADLKRFQFAHDLAPDAAAQPGGPTVHMLTRKVFGAGDGPPPESETEFFRERFDKDPNRTLSGQPIFGEEGLAGDGAELVPTRFKLRPGGGVRPRPGKPRQGSEGDGSGQPPSGRPPRGGPGGGRRSPDPIIPQGKPKPERQFDDESDGPKKPTVAETPVPIFRYPDGRLYVAVDGKGRIAPRSEPGSTEPQDIDTETRLNGIRDVWNKAYPNLKARRSFQQRRAAGVESYVYGPVFNKSGEILHHEILIDPRSGEPLRAPVGKEILLTKEQVRKMGLERWYNPHGR